MNLGTLAGAGKIVADLAKDKNITDTGSKLLGMLCPYLGLKKKAVDMYVKEIEESNLPPETKVFTILNTKKTFKKLKNQGKIAEIAVENAKEGTDFSEKSRVDEEWFDRFMDAASYVSSDKMQEIWGRILAKEFEEPGTTPKSMIRILSEISPECADAFSKIANMKVLLIQLEGDDAKDALTRYFVPYRDNENYMVQLGLKLEMMNELESLGLITFNYLNGYLTENAKMTSKNIIIWANGKSLFTKNSKSEIPIGNVLLTKAGEALSNITPPKDNDENYIEAVKIYLNKKSYNFEYTSDYKVEVNGNIVNVTRNSII